MSEDRGFKALFDGHPRETFAVFLPELLAERGVPASITVLPQESVPPDPRHPSLFLDTALLASWDDGGPPVILQIEHWSELRKIERRRALWYLADLARKHPTALVVPASLVTDPKPGAVPDRLEMVVSGVTYLSMRIRVLRITAEDLPRLRSLNSMVATVLSTLAFRVKIPDPVEVVLATIREPGFFTSHPDKRRQFLPLITTLAKITEADHERLRQQVRKDPAMFNILDEIHAEGEAKGLAKGEAKGEAKGLAKGLAKASRVTVETILRLVEQGIMSRDNARAVLQELMSSGDFSREIGEQALAKLT